MRYTDPTGHGPVEALVSIAVHSQTIIDTAKKYGLPADLLASVVWNENKFRGLAHLGKDVAGLVIKGEASLGLTQVQMATAAFLDTNPDPASLKGITNEQFEAMKRDAFEKADKEALAKKLLDPKTAIDYAGKYLSLVASATDADLTTTIGAQTTLANYNRGADNWSDAPSAYGLAYREYIAVAKFLLPFVPIPK